MPVFYTVDREKRLTEGCIIQLVRYGDIEPPDLQKHVGTLFPNGLTSHGERYLLRSNLPPTAFTDSKLEILFEYVRRAEFPQCPSRYESFFAWEDLPSAARFRLRYGDLNSLVWEIQADRAFRADMNLLQSGESITSLVKSYFAHLYWQGKPGFNEPFWECLLVPPVTVLRRVNP